MTDRVPLTPADLEVLEFERLTWGSPGRRETAIRERFGYSLTRYGQRLQAIIRHPEADAYDPTHVRRLIRLRDERARRRGAPR